MNTTRNNKIFIGNRGIYLFGGGGWAFTPYKTEGTWADYVLPIALGVLTIAGLGSSIAGSIKSKPKLLSLSSIISTLSIEGNNSELEATEDSGPDNIGLAYGGPIYHRFADGGTAGVFDKIGSGAQAVQSIALVYLLNAAIDNAAVNGAKLAAARKFNLKVSANSFDSLMADWGHNTNAATAYNWRDFYGASDGKRALNTFIGSSNAAILGFKAGGMWGAIAGGVGGLISGFLGSGAARRRAKRQAREANQAGLVANTLKTNQFIDRANMLNKQLNRVIARSFTANGGPLNFGLIYGVGGALGYDYMNSMLANKRLAALNKLSQLSPINMDYSSYPLLDNNSLFSFGGNLGTNGADFTDGLTYFDNGGRHEENPNQGVPLGIAPDGLPNLVEEGEVKWNELEYIFSDRLSPSETLLERWHLPKSWKNKTYAEVVKKSPIVKEAELRPNDEGSLKTMDDFLESVMQDLEETKAQKEANEILEQMDNMSPEELQLLNSSLEQLLVAEQQAQLEEMLAQLLALQLQMSPEEAMIMQLQLLQIMPQQPIMGACGGHLHAEGGDIMMQPEIPMLEPVLLEPLSEEEPQEQTTRMAAEEMSTKELNQAIDEIILFATDHKDRALLREAKSVKRKGTREEKEAFVDEAYEEIDEIIKEEQTQSATESLESPEQEVPLETTAMQSQLEVSPEGIAEESEGNTFAKGGDLNSDIDESLSELLNLGESYNLIKNNLLSKTALLDLRSKAEDNTALTELLSGTDEDLLTRINNELMLRKAIKDTSDPTRMLGLVEVIADMPKLKTSTNPSSTVNTEPLNRPIVADLLSSVAVDALNTLNPRFKNTLADKIDFLEGVQEELKKQKIQDFLLGNSNSYAYGGKIALDILHQDGSISTLTYLFDPVTNKYKIHWGNGKAQEYDSLEEALTYTSINESLYKEIIKESKRRITLQRVTVNKDGSYSYINKNGRRTTVKSIDEVGKALGLTEEELDAYYGAKGSIDKGHYTYKPVVNIYKDGDSYRFTIRNKNGESKSYGRDDIEDEYATEEEARAAAEKIVKREYGENAYESAKVVSPSTLKGLLTGTTHTGKPYVKAHNRYYDPETGLAVSASDIPNENAQPSTAPKSATARQAATNTSISNARTNTNTNSSTSNLVKPYAYDDINTFKYYDKDKQAYNENYRKFIEGLTDELIKDLLDNWWGDNGENFNRFTGAGGTKEAVTAERMKDPNRGALDGKYSDLHKFAAALYEAQLRKQQQEEAAKEGKPDATVITDPTNGDPNATTVITGGGQGNGKTLLYRIAYPDANGVLRYHTIQGYNPNKQISAVEGVYDPTKHILTAPSSNKPDEDGFITFTRGDIPLKAAKPKMLPTFMRYASLLDYANAPNGMGAVDVINGGLANLQYIGAPRHGEYSKYEIPSTLFELNKFDEAANGTQRGIINAANGNTGLLMANLANARAKDLQARGELMLGLDDKAWKRKMDVINLHNETDKTWDAMALEADKANMSNNSLIMLAARDLANILWDAEQSLVAADNATRTNRLNNLSAIGKENLAYNMANSNDALRFGVNPFTGQSNFKGITDLSLLGYVQNPDGSWSLRKAANGGCLTIKRKRRK